MTDYCMNNSLRTVTGTQMAALLANSNPEVHDNSYKQTHVIEEKTSDLWEHRTSILPWHNVPLASGILTDRDGGQTYWDSTVQTSSNDTSLWSSRHVFSIACVKACEHMHVSSSFCLSVWGPSGSTQTGGIYRVTPFCPGQLLLKGNPY